MTEGRFGGRTAVVTGAGTGIGRAVALAIAGEGAKVVLAGRRRAPLEETREMLKDPGAGLVFAGDQSSETDVERLFASAVEFGGTVDILVNNAAIAGAVGNIWELELEGWTEALSINLTGPWLCSRAAARIMIPQRSGKIVNVGSVSGKRPLATRTPYTTTKMGLVGLTRTLALELGEYGVNVNLVSPGAVRTPRLDELAEKWDKPVDELISGMAQLAALKRISEPDDIANAVVFLVSDEARNITGFDLTVDAGVWFS
jgi:NAD(P)-dependent dehydrogenase (short-subunit alcohol dehydrogenase family)